MSFTKSLHALVEGDALWGLLVATGNVLLLVPFLARIAGLVGDIRRVRPSTKFGGVAGASRVF